MAESGSDERASRSRWRSSWTIAIVVAAVLVIVLSVWLTFRGASDTDGQAPSPSPSPSPSASIGDESSDPSASPSPQSSSGAPATDEPFPELTPADPDAEVDAEGIVISITKVEHVEGEAVAPGDVAGAAVRLTFSLSNGTDADFASNAVAVNAYIGPDRTPAEPYEQPGGTPFSDVVKPGGHTDAVYVFRIAADQRADVTVVVDYRAGAPSVVFQGSLAEER